MRPALPAALAASTLFAGLIAGESLLAQSLLSQLEQRIQGTQSPAAGGAAPGGVVAAPGAGETGYLGAVLDEAGENRGVRVNSVKPGAPAATGGLQGGDLIQAIDGKPIANLDDLDAVLNHVGPGQKVRFGVDRNKTQQQVTVTLGKRPAAASTPDEPSSGLAAAPPSLAPPTTFGTPSTSTPSTSIPPSSIPSIGVAAADTAPGTLPLTQPPSTEPPSALSPPISGLPPASLPSTSPPSQPLSLGPPPGTSPSTALPAFQPSRSFSSPSIGGGAAGGGAIGGGRASLGITVEPLTPQTRGATIVPAQRGAIVTQVKPGSPAELAGLPVNVVIVQADGQRINSADDLVRFVKAAQPGQEVELTYYEGNQMVRKNVRLGSADAASDIAGAPSGTRGTGRRSPAAPATGLPRADTGAAAGGAIPGGPLSPGAGGNRPLLNRIEGMANRLSGGGLPPEPPLRGRALSTVYDPLQMAALQQSVEELTEVVRSLEQRLAAIEAKVGVSPAKSTSGGIAPEAATPGTSGPNTLPTNP